LTIFPALPPGKLAAIALVVALFVCHGVYGFEHQLAEHQPGGDAGAVHATQSGPMGAHHAPSKGGDTDQEAMPNGGYFAVLISMLLVMILWSWRGGLRVPDAREALRVTTRTLAPPVPYPPRGPTLYLFQVMRL
jgi:hypothetical protein